MSQTPSFAGSPLGPEVGRLLCGATWMGAHPLPPAVCFIIRLPLESPLKSRALALPHLSA